MNSVAGVPQGSIVSLLLSDVYLHELDRFVMDQIVCQYSKGEGKTGRTRLTTAYRRLTANLKAVRKRLDACTDQSEREELRRRFAVTKSEMLRTPAMKADPEFIRIKYVRYADDWIIGINGPRRLAETIRHDVGQFLAEQLKLTLSPDKTHVRHAKSEEAFFLGTRIRIGATTPKIMTISRNGKSFKKRVAGWTPKLLAPTERLVERLASRNFCTAKGAPLTKGAWVTLDDDQIVGQYASVLRGLTNYYSFVDNFGALSRVQYILQHSAAKTLAAKHRSKVPQIFRKHGKRLTVKRVTRSGEVKLSSMGLISDWSPQPNRFMATHAVQTGEVPLFVRLRTRSKIGEACVICGELNDIQMHHVRHIRKMGEDVKGFTRLMAVMNRKQIPVCTPCHHRIHAGTYDGLAIRDLAHADVAAR